MLEDNSNSDLIDNELNKKLLNGYFGDDIPEYKIPQIKVFISSTFSDYALERDYLMKEIYKNIKKKCIAEYQMDFQLIDMRWGMNNDEMSNLQISSDAYLEELKRCCTDSIGPSFVVLLSNKYGHVSLKTKIIERHYNLIKQKLSDENKKSTFETFYAIDDNNMNTREYKIKTKEEIKESLQKSEEEYRHLYSELSLWIQQAIYELKTSEVISEEESKPYFTSLIELEIDMGLFKCDKDVKNLKCAAFFRSITNASEEDQADNRFFHQTHRVTFLKKLIEAHLNDNSNNIKYYEVSYGLIKSQLEGIARTYIEKFGQDFENVLNALIKQNVEAYLKADQQKYDTELVHHSRMVNRLTKSIIEPKEIKQIEENYINKRTNSHYHVKGSDGCGKSTLMAALAKKLRKEKPNSIIIIRFVGTSPASSKFTYLLKSINNQLKSISKASKFKKDTAQILENRILTIRAPIEDNQQQDIYDCCKEMEGLLNLIAEKNKKEIIILFDGIDYLATVDLKMNLVLPSLPDNVKMIVSKNSKSQSGNVSDRYSLEIKPYDVKESMNSIMELLKDIQRRVTDEQQNRIKYVLNMAHNNQIFPLHIKLLFDIVSEWTSSYRVTHEFSSCISIKSTVIYLFKYYEKLFGDQLFKHCIFYITLFGQNGIPENELLDILTIDDDVLNELFTDYHPTERKFPITVWLRIKLALKDYLVQRMTDGIPCVAWYHNAFIDAARDHYANLFKKSALKDCLLRNIIDYYTEKWCLKKSNGLRGESKKFEFFNNDEVIRRYKTNKPNEFSAYRYTRPQTMVVQKETYIGYNFRKLNQLLKVISMLSDLKLKVDLLIEEVYFNYEFVFAKAHVKDLEFFVNATKNIKEMLKSELEIMKNDGKDKELLKKCDELIELSSIYTNIGPVLCNNPNLLYLKLMKNLKKHTPKYINYQKAFDHYVQLSLLSNNIETDIATTLFETNNACDYTIVRTFVQFEQQKPVSLFICYENKLEILSVNTNERNHEFVFYHLIGKSVKFSIIVDTDTRNSRIYYCNDNQIFGKSLENGINFKYLEKNSRYDLIKDIYILKMNRMIVFMQKHIVLFELNEKELFRCKRLCTIDISGDLEVKEYKIMSNIQKEIVFTASELEKNMNNIVFLIFLPNKFGYIYKVKNEKIDLVKQIDFKTYLGVSYADYTLDYTNNIVIDESCTIYNEKFKFFVYNQDTHNNRFNYTKFTIGNEAPESKTFAFRGNNAIITRYFNQKIMIISDESFLIYDESNNKEIFGKRETTNFQNERFEVDFIGQNGIIVETCNQGYDNKAMLRVYKLTDEKLTKVLEVTDVYNTHFEIISSSIDDIGTLLLLVKTENLNWRNMYRSSYVSKILKYEIKNCIGEYIPPIQNKIVFNKIVCALDDEIILIEAIKNNFNTLQAINLNNQDMLNIVYDRGDLENKNVRAVHYEVRDEYLFICAEKNCQQNIEMDVNNAPLFELYYYTFTIEKTEKDKILFTMIDSQKKEYPLELKLTSVTISTSFSSDSELKASASFLCRFYNVNNSKRFDDNFIVFVSTNNNGYETKYFSQRYDENSIQFMLQTRYIVTITDKMYLSRLNSKNEVIKVLERPLLKDDLLGYDYLHFAEGFLCFGKSGYLKRDDPMANYTDFVSHKRDYIYYQVIIADNRLKILGTKLFTSSNVQERVKIEKTYFFVINPTDVEIYELGDIVKNKRMGNRIILNKKDVYDLWLSNTKERLIILTTNSEIFVYRFPELIPITINYPIQIEHGLDDIKSGSFSIVSNDKYMMFISNGELYRFQINS